MAVSHQANGVPMKTSAPVRLWLVAATLGLPLVLAIREQRSAWAGDPSPRPSGGPSTFSPIERIDGASGPPKSPGALPPTLPAVPACALALYAKFGDEVKLLAERHVGDPAAYQAAYAAKKQEMLGQAVMDAIGCRGGGK